MGSKKVQEGLNEQIRRELYAAYLYLSMMNYFEAEGLPGFAHWMRFQAREELAHAMKIVDFVNDAGGRVELGAIDQPPVDFDSPAAVMRQALEHERHVTADINGLYELAADQADYAAQVMLQWFVTEQVEEEKVAKELVDQLELAGDSGGALLVLDQKLARREPE